jgi:GlcNAc-PI de-N-acetylase
VATVILSPHLDDAVLSCWHVLTQPGEASVINVFAGVPTHLGEPAWWDAYTGATDSATRVRERIEEDRRALALAGRTATYLGFLDEQYRDQPQPLEPLVEEIGRRLQPGAHVHAAAALTQHTDHALVRSAALALRAAGFVVSLYADLPHATAHGWPAWVTGSQTPATKDFAAAAWGQALAGAEALAPVVHELDLESHAQKLAAVRMYATQLQALAEFAGRSLSDPELLGFEVQWATAAPAQARHPSASGL